MALPSDRSVPTASIASVLAALVFSMVLLSATATLFSAYAAEDREQQRSTSVSTEPSSTDVFVRSDRDLWRDRSIYVSWLAPAAASRSSVHPPGMESLPTPGCAVVSPEVDRLARLHSDLARLYPCRSVLTDAGLARADELVVYLTPGSGRRLGGEATALRFEAGVPLGDSGTVRAGGFGDGPALPAFADEPFDEKATLLVALGLGGIPAVLSLALAVLWSRGPSRDGGARGIRRWAPPAVGVLVGASSWLLWAAVSDVVPLTGVPDVPGHSSGALGLLVVIAVGCIVAAAVDRLARYAEARVPRGRPPTQRTGPSWRVVPLAASAVLFAASAWTRLDEILPLRALASVLAVVGAVAVVPVVLERVGRRMSTSRSATVSAAARAGSSDLLGWARPVYGVAAIAATALIILPADVPEGTTGGLPYRPGDVSVVGIEWSDVREGDLAALRANSGSLTILPVAGAGHDHSADAGGAAPTSTTEDHEGDQDDDRHVGHEGHEDGAEEPASSLRIGGTCSDLEQAFPVRCSDANHLDAASQRVVAARVSAGLGVEIESVTLVDEERLVEDGRVIVFAVADDATVDAQARAVARAVLPAATVEGLSINAGKSFTDQRRLNATVDTLLLLAALLVLTAGVRRALLQAPASGDTTAYERITPVVFLLAHVSAVGVGVLVGCVVRLQSPPTSAGDSLSRDLQSVLLVATAGGVVACLALWGARRAGVPAAATRPRPSGVGARA